MFFFPKKAYACFMLKMRVKCSITSIIVFFIMLFLIVYDLIGSLIAYITDYRECVDQEQDGSMM